MLSLPGPLGASQPTACLRGDACGQVQRVEEPHISKPRVFPQRPPARGSRTQAGWRPEVLALGVQASWVLCAGASIYSSVLIGLGSQIRKRRTKRIPGSALKRVVSFRLPGDLWAG